MYSASSQPCLTVLLLVKILLGQSSNGHGEEIQASSPAHALLGRIKSASLRKERRVGEIKFRPEHAGRSRIDIRLYKKGAPWMGWASRGRRGDGARLDVTGLAGGRCTRALSSGSRCRLAKKRKHLGMSPDKIRVPVHVHVRTASNFGESVLRRQK